MTKTFFPGGMTLKFDDSYFFPAGIRKFDEITIQGVADYQGADLEIIIKMKGDLIGSFGCGLVHGDAIDIVIEDIPFFNN